MMSALIFDNDFIATIYNSDMSLKGVLKSIIVNAGGFTKNELEILNFLEMQNMHKSSFFIAKSLRIPKSTVVYSLKKLHKWRLVQCVGYRKKLWGYRKLIERAGVPINWKVYKMEKLEKR